MRAKTKQSYRYRLTSVTTVDYGDSPCAGKTVHGELAVIPDGSRWDDRPVVIRIALPEGTRPGAIYRVTIEQIEGDS